MIQKKSLIKMLTILSMVKLDIPITDPSYEKEVLSMLEVVKDITNALNEIEKNGDASHSSSDANL